MARLRSAKYCNKGINAVNQSPPQSKLRIFIHQTQWDKITYKAMMTADIILISFCECEFTPSRPHPQASVSHFQPAWLKNKCFTDQHEEPMDDYTPFEIRNTKKNRLPADYRINVIRRRGMEFKRKNNALDEKVRVHSSFLISEYVSNVFAIVEPYTRALHVPPSGNRRRP